MANNRMYIVCLHCVHEESCPIKESRFYIAKYYPSTGWYATGESLKGRLNEFFDRHRHQGCAGDMYGDFFILGTESLLADDPSEHKRRLLDALSNSPENRQR